MNIQPFQAIIIFKIILKIIIFYIELGFFNFKNNGIIILNNISYSQYINIFMT